MRKITIKNDSAVALLPSHRHGPGSLNEKLLSTAKVRTLFGIARDSLEKMRYGAYFFDSSPSYSSEANLHLEVVVVVIVSGE